MSTKYAFQRALINFHVISLRTLLLLCHLPGCVYFPGGERGPTLIISVELPPLCGEHRLGRKLHHTIYIQSLSGYTYIIRFTVAPAAALCRSIRAGEQQLERRLLLHVRGPVGAVPCRRDSAGPCLVGACSRKGLCTLQLGELIKQMAACLCPTMHAICHARQRKLCKEVSLVECSKCIH